MTERRLIADNAAPVEITFLVTSYNEAEYLWDTLETVCGAVLVSGRSFEVIVIDDVSRDKSVSVVKEFMAKHPDLPICLHVNDRNRGVGNNFIDGAFLGRGEYYRLIDGDCSESRETISYLLGLLGVASLIIPVMANNSRVSGRSFPRVVLSKTFVGLVNMLAGQKIRYYNQSPIFRRYDVMRWPPVTTGLGYQADIVTRFLFEGVDFMQIPVETCERKFADSTAISLANILSAAHVLLEIALRRLKRLLGRCAYGADAVPPMGSELNLHDLR